MNFFKNNIKYITILFSGLFVLFGLIACDNEDNNNSTIIESDALFPCENGFADIYPCNGYELMAQIPLSTFAASAGNDSWGWTDPTTGKEYALMGLDNGTAFVDITDPLETIYLGKLPTETISNSWRDIKVFNNHAFIVADVAGNHGMQVFDLTRLRNVANPPETFTTDALYTGVDSCHNVVINENESIAYLVGCSNNGGGPIFIDISSPTNPTFLGEYTAEGYSHDAQVVTYNGPDVEHQGKQIYIGSNGYSNNVVILDVTDKSNIIPISSLSYPQEEFAHQGWFTEDQRYFILGDELDEGAFGFNTKTIIFDFNDLDNPVLSSTFFGPTLAVDHNGYVKDNTYYLSNYRAGMRVLDISNISDSSNPMTEIGFFDTYPENNNAGTVGAWNVYPYFESGNIIISDIIRGLFVVRKSNL
ncbi:choice-of-anchor B family protein [uncultured Algibacter sp.]|uniref:choice-of-anchor B family protein n=1 Tax=uncultured Algibacter sp. TaxID=298659 RepID=UPI0026133FA9|nr:choice-of-anchor B family protein [uncultured Algibacter sp.]